LSTRSWGFKPSLLSGFITFVGGVHIKVTHDGFKNRHSFVKDNKTITLVPLSPRQVHEDQMKLKKENELKKICEAEGSKKDDEKESERKKERQKIMREKQKKKKKTTEDVFPNDVPSGLPPIRGIEHQIDFVPSASIPN